MRQKKLGNVLWVLSQEPYQITKDLDVSVIYVDTNLYDEYVKLNQSLDLTRFNYLLVRKHDPEYLPYVDAKEEIDFDFLDSIVNVSSYVDETKTVQIQELAVPDDFDGEIKYFMDGVELSEKTIELTNAGTYTISAITTGSKEYADDMENSYQIIYTKEKRTATLSFAQSTIYVNSFVDEDYSGTIKTVSGAPDGVEINYYLNDVKLSSNEITLTTNGPHTITAKIENDAVYKDTHASYVIVYSKIKRNATLSFAQSSVNVESFVDETYTGQIQTVSGAPSGVTIHYYLDNVEINSNEITLSTAGQHTVKAAIENDSVYNNTYKTYTINYVKNKRTATLSFANQEVTEKINQDLNSSYSTYSGQVQEVVGVPNGVQVNYYLDNTLLTNGEINISDLRGSDVEVCEYNYTITAKIENDPVYNDAEASYTLNIIVKAETPAFGFPDRDVYETVNDVTTYSGQVQEASGIIEGANHNYYLGDTLLTNGEINISDLQEGENIYTITCKIENDPVWSDLSASYKLHITRIITPYENQYLTIESKENNNTISFKCSKEEIPRTILVSTDNGNTWTEKTSTTSGVELATLNKGDILRIKGENISYAQSTALYNMFDTNIYSSCNVYGNIMSLIYGDNFKNKTEFPENSTYNFLKLFYDCNSIVSAENLILPTTTLTSSCYANMFGKCTRLTTAPELPATTLANQCYNNMFNGCSNLTNAPALPATTLMQSCYSFMFSGCTGLTTAPALPATTLVGSCYNKMFYGCTGLTTAPALPATTLVASCYQCMFQNCSNLTTVPELPATTLVQSCYSQMFNGCSKLNYIKALFTTTPTGAYTQNWVNGVSSTGTFVKSSEATWDLTGVNGIPEGWTVETFNNQQYILTFYNYGNHVEDNLEEFCSDKNNQVISMYDWNYFFQDTLTSQEIVQTPKFGIFNTKELYFDQEINGVQIGTASQPLTADNITVTVYRLDNESDDNLIESKLRTFEVKDEFSECWIRINDDLTNVNVGDYIWYKIMITTHDVVDSNSNPIEDKTLNFIYQVETRDQ